jgi:hypothetical protein
LLATNDYLSTITATAMHVGPVTPLLIAVVNALFCSDPFGVSPICSRAPRKAIHSRRADRASPAVLVSFIADRA